VGIRVHGSDQLAAPPSASKNGGLLGTVLSWEAVRALGGTRHLLAQSRSTLSPGLTFPGGFAFFAIDAGLKPLMG